MSIEHMFTLVCDDARIEQSGKLIVVGLYNRAIQFNMPNAPAQGTGLPEKIVLPQLCFIQRWAVKGDSQYPVSATLVDPEGGKRLIAKGIRMAAVADGSYPQQIMFLQGAVLVNGVYHLITSDDSTSEPLHDEEFEVRIQKKSLAS